MKINEIFQEYAPEYIERFGDLIPFEHRKVIDAMINCRTESSGTLIYQCEQCGKTHIVYRSCGNRHCPNCQHHKTHQWLTKQVDRQLPGHHFMITFTVPQKLRRFIRSHQHTCCGAMFKASSETMKKLAADEKYIGGDLPGFLGVLHTWGRQLVYHPHIHYMVPGGALSKKDDSWHPSRIDFYLPVKAMSRIFKAKFRDEMSKSNLLSSIPQDVWDQDWVVNSQAIGAGAHSIKYLSRYVFKVAISNSRIIKVKDRDVFFKYKKPGSNRWRTMVLNVMEFMRRFLQHVLPSGFMKVRYYGFLSPGASVPLEKIKALIELSFGFEITIPKTTIDPFNFPKCSHCGGKLKFVISIPHARLIRSDSG
ncbi:MAG: transposase [Deltaproteobacteria bacterium]|nr:transposase [Deltaproteobacteria bacterium]MBW2046730.1 transposase [Deltaproteobacteria bacterium]